MDLKILKQEPARLKMVVEGTTPTMMNALRRAIVNHVPVLAIEDVTIVKNSSAMYDEMLAHRLGLIPLTTDAESYKRKEDCRCKGEGCARCQVTFTLTAKGPCTVYAESLKGKDPKVKPVFGKIPLVKLLKDQEIELEATAILGEGSTHAKFSPALVYYQGYPEFTIKSTTKDVAKVCPVNILKFDGKKISVTDVPACILCKACEDADPENVQVGGSAKKFILTVESWGQREAKDILTAAVEVIEQKVDVFEGEVKKLKL